MEKQWKFRTLKNFPLFFDSFPIFLKIQPLRPGILIRKTNDFYYLRVYIAQLRHQLQHRRKKHLYRLIQMIKKYSHTDKQIYTCVRACQGRKFALTAHSVQRASPKKQRREEERHTHTHTHTHTERSRRSKISKNRFLLRKYPKKHDFCHFLGP